MTQTNTTQINKNEHLIKKINKCLPDISLLKITSLDMSDTPFEEQTGSNIEYYALTTKSSEWKNGFCGCGITEHEALFDLYKQVASRRKRNAFSFLFGINLPNQKGAICQ